MNYFSNTRRLGLNGTLLWDQGSDYFRTVTPDGYEVKENFATADYANWYKSGGNNA